MMKASTGIPIAISKPSLNPILQLCFRMYQS